MTITGSILAKSRLLLLAALASTTGAQVPQSIPDVQFEMDAGKLAFTNITFTEISHVRSAQVYRVVAEIENYTHAEFWRCDIQLHFGENSAGVNRIRFTEMGIAAEGRTRVHQVLSAREMPGVFTPAVAKVECGSRSGMPAEIAAREAREAREAAAAKKLADERKAEAAQRAAASERYYAYLRKLPKLNRDGAPVPVATDVGCLEETEAVLGVEGLDARKKLTELLSYGCIFIPDVNTPVKRVGWIGSAIRVLIADGEYRGRSGWVRQAWLK